jgi:hypothetical protein
MDPVRLASLERSMRLLKTWFVVLSVLLLVSLGANAVWVQASSDPPIRVYTANADDAGGGGSATTIDFPITPPSGSEPPVILGSVTTRNLSRHHDHICLVTASARVGFPGANPPVNSGRAVFGLSRGTDSEILLTSERQVHLLVTDDEDSITEEVSTTFALTGVRRDETIRFSAHWISGSAMLAFDPSMTVVCLRHSI